MGVWGGSGGPEPGGQEVDYDQDTLYTCHDEKGGREETLKLT